MLLVFVIAGILEESSPGGMDEDSLAASTLGCFFLALLFLSVLAFGMGVGGCFIQSRKKTLSIIGATISAGTIFVSILLVILGLAIG